MVALGTVTLQTGCNGNTDVVITAAWGASTPIVDLTITALPFDPDRIIDSLEALAAIERPDFTDLEAEMLAYEPPADERFEEASRPWRALRDTVQQLADSLIAIGRSAPGYSTQYARFRQLYARLAQRAAERDDAIRRLGGNQMDLARRAAVAAESLRTWEYEALASYAEIAGTKVLLTGHDAVEATTDEEGEAHFSLAPGRWWLVARYADPENPFMEYYWNVPVTMSMLPVRLPFSLGNSERRWRR
jgi:hypothetical protein